MVFSRSLSSPADDGYIQVEEDSSDTSTAECFACHWQKAGYGFKRCDSLVAMDVRSKGLLNFQYVLEEQATTTVLMLGNGCVLATMKDDVGGEKQDRNGGWVGR